MAMPWAGDAAGRLVRTLYLVAMALFVVTIVIGIINGLDLYEFDRNQLLTHVHSGTVGWLSLAIIGSAMWMSRTGNRTMALAFAILIPAYVLAFYSGNLPARAATGVALLLAMAWLFAWSWRWALADRSLPALAVTLGISSFFYGGVIGVLLQVQLATGASLFPDGADIIGAHAGTMTFAYLILAAMGFLEWRVRGTTGMPILGLVQVVALFGGGALLAVVSIFAPAQVQAIGGIYLLVELVAVVLFAIRILPAAIRANQSRGSASAYLAAGSLFVVVAMALYLYLVVSFLGDPTAPFESFFPILVASDHAAFIGVTTNVVLGLMFGLAADRSDARGVVTRVAFWVMNLGLATFLVGLATETAILKQVGAPSMGVALLVLLAVAAMRLRASDLSAAQPGG